MIGSGDRSEKIRTYNFPQDRITDHRLKKNWHSIDLIMDGGLDDLIYSLQKETLIGLNNTIATVDYEKQQIFTNSNIGYVLDAFEDISGNIEYGLDPVYEVTEIDKDLKEPQIKLRRLEFRPLSFVPKKESNKSKKVDIQFG